MSNCAVCSKIATHRCDNAPDTCEIHKSSCCVRISEEPLYTFVRGKGWVYDTTEFIDVITLDNVKVRIYNRPPRAGELYFQYHPESPVGMDTFPERCYWFGRNRRSGDLIKFYSGHGSAVEIINE